MMAVFRLDLGGRTAAARRLSSSVRSQSTSNALSPRRAPKATSAISGGDTARIMALGGQQHKAHQVSQRVHQRDDFGRQSAARAPDGLILSPPFAPLAFWWAVTIVPSIRAYSKSGSRHSQSRRGSKTPASTQRRKR